MSGVCHFENASNVTLSRRNFEHVTITGTVSLDLCLGKNRAGKLHNYRDIIVFEKLRFQNVFRPN